MPRNLVDAQEQRARNSFESGAYPFETCAECEPKVIELLQEMLWVAPNNRRSSHQRGDQEHSRKALLSDWLKKHRADAGHGPRNPGEKSQT